jgi:hypothetical protein
MNLKKPGMESDADAKKTSENRKKIFATALTLFTETGILRHPTSLISKVAACDRHTLPLFQNESEPDRLALLPYQERGGIGALPGLRYREDCAGESPSSLVQCSRVGITESCEAEVY